MINKIYSGWVLQFPNGRQWTVKGQNKIRSTTWYWLSSGDDTRSVDRKRLLDGLNDGSIKYIESVAV